MAKKDSIKMLEAKIEVLQRARKKIKTEESRGICAAIYWSYDCYSTQEVVNASQALRNYIGDRLGISSYLDGWLMRKRPKFDRSDKNMKKYRLQWIDWMIQCLQEDLASKTKKDNK